MIKIDWEQHRNSNGITCVFTPREKFNGQAIRPGLNDRRGDAAQLIALWLMDANDPYPGEWALGAADRSHDVFGLMWVASGDVTPIKV